MFRSTGTANIRRLNHAGCTSTCDIYTSERSKVERSVSSSAGAALKGCGMAFLEVELAGLTARCWDFGGIIKDYEIAETMTGFKGSIGRYWMW